MNQQEFEYIYERFTYRRKEVLQRALEGETDVIIAESMKIGQTTVRKHIERTCQEFGLDDKNQPGRRSRRSELVALFAKYKPELLNKHSNTIFSSTKNFDIVETIETQQQYTVFAQKLNTFLEEYKSKNIFSHDLIKQFQECCNETEIANLLNKKGLECYNNKDLTGADFFLNRAIQFNSAFPECHYNLGLVYEGMNDLEQARSHYEKATSVTGKKNNHAVFAAINNLSRLLIMQDISQNQVVIEMINRILSQVQVTNIKASLFKNLGWAYFQQGDYKEAKQNLLKSLELYHDYAPAHCLLAKVLEAQGNKKDALDSWNKFLESYSDKTRFKYLPELTGWKTDAQRILKAENK